MSEREKHQRGREPFGGLPRRPQDDRQAASQPTPQGARPAGSPPSGQGRFQQAAQQRARREAEERTQREAQREALQRVGQRRAPQGQAPTDHDRAAPGAARQRRRSQAPRERRFAARGSYRAQGGFALTIGTLMLFAAGALWGRFQDGDSPLNALGAVICACCGALLLYAGWQVARPQSLLLTQRGGSLHRLGSATRSWQWSEADRVEWIEPARGRFATPEPFLVLRGYEASAPDAQRYLIPLTPFSELAYAAIRERLLLNS